MRRARTSKGCQPRSLTFMEGFERELSRPAWAASGYRPWLVGFPASINAMLEKTILTAVGKRGRIISGLLWPPVNLLGSRACLRRMRMPEGCRMTTFDITKKSNERCHVLRGHQADVDCGMLTPRPLTKPNPTRQC